MPERPLFDPIAVSAEGWQLWREERYGEARDKFLKFMRRGSPDLAYGHYALGICEYKLANNAIEALQHLEQAVAGFTKSGRHVEAAQTMTNLGLLMANENLPETAAKLIKQSSSYLLAHRPDVTDQVALQRRLARNEEYLASLRDKVGLSDYEG